MEGERFIQILEIRVVDSSVIYEETNEGSFMFRLMSLLVTAAGPKRKKTWLNEYQFETQIKDAERRSLLVGFRKSMEVVSKNEAMKSYAGKISVSFFDGFLLSIHF